MPITYTVVAVASQSDMKAITVNAGTINQIVYSEDPYRSGLFKCTAGAVPPGDPMAL